MNEHPGPARPSFLDLLSIASRLARSPFLLLLLNVLLLSSAVVVGLFVQLGFGYAALVDKADLFASLALYAALAAVLLRLIMAATLVAQNALTKPTAAGEERIPWWIKHRTAIGLTVWAAAIVLFLSAFVWLRGNLLVASFSLCLLTAAAIILIGLTDPSNRWVLATVTGAALLTLALSIGWAFPDFIRDRQPRVRISLQNDPVDRVGSILLKANDGLLIFLDDADPLTIGLKLTYVPLSEIRAITEDERSAGP